MATQTLSDFIAARKAQIRSQISDLKMELRQLLAAETAAKEAIGACGDRAKSKPRNPSATIKDDVIELLALTAGGQTANAILEGLKQSFGRKIERSSLSPQLSRLKRDGVLQLSGKVWTLSETAKADYDEMAREKFEELFQDPRNTSEPDEESEGFADPSDNEGDSDDPF